MPPAPESAPTESAGRRLARVAAPALVGALLWLNWFAPPAPPGIDLDSSWMAVLADAAVEGRRFGEEVVFTFGPLGWLASFHLTPEAWDGKMLWEFLGKGAIAATLVLFGLRLSAPRRWFFYAAVLCFGGLFADTVPLLVIVVAVLGWVFPGRTPPWAFAVVLAGLAVLAQIKFTYSLLILAGVLLAVTSAVATRRWRHGAAVAAGFAVAYPLAWIAAGQRVSDLPVYWAGSLEVARGYAPAMGLDSSLAVLLTGLAVLAGCGVFLLSRLRLREDRGWIAPATLFLGAAVALAWKHGFTRADGHVVGFFTVVALLTLAVPPLLGARRDWPLAAAMIALCFLGIRLSDPWLGSNVLTLAEHRVRRGWADVASASTLRTRFDEAHSAATAALDQSALAARIGDATVDLIGHEQGRLLLGGFNHSPRPVFQGYSAYTPRLAAKNLEFFRSERAPTFVVARLETIDGRHPMSDDALVLAELLRRYDVVDETQEHLLMHRREPRPGPRDFELVDQLVTNVVLGQTVHLPPADGFAQWIRIVGYPTTLGKLRSAFVRPPVLFLILIETSGRETIHRLVLPTAAQGFIVNPLIENVTDYALLARELQWKAVQAIRLEAARPDEAEFWVGAGVSISSMPEFPSAHLDPEAMAYEGGIANRAPERVHSDVTKMVLRDEIRAEYLVHAPGEMVFSAVGAKRLSGVFRITEGAYTGEGVTDGADFLVEAVLGDGSTLELWRRRLAPLNEPRDRGFQDFSVELPEGVVTVRLRTLPGPVGNTDWDWTTWSELRFSSSP